jgi:hypothetical protein
MLETAWFIVDNESLIINTSEDYEREELAKKYGIVDTGRVLISRMLLISY